MRFLVSLTGEENDMGYRSDVAAVFYVSKAEHYPVLKLWLDENFPINEWDENIRWFDRGMVFECPDVKWYDSYPDVQGFEKAASKFVDLCNDEVSEGTPTFNYELVRIGEDYDDVEVVREGIACEYLLEVSRGVVVEV
jgi:hypothetical protein